MLRFISASRVSQERGFLLDVLDWVLNQHQFPAPVIATPREIVR